MGPDIFLLAGDIFTRMAVEVCQRLHMQKSTTATNSRRKSVEIQGCFQDRIKIVKRKLEIEHGNWQVMFSVKAQKCLCH